MGPLACQWQVRRSWHLHLVSWCWSFAHTLTRVPACTLTHTCTHRLSYSVLRPDIIKAMLHLVSSCLYENILEMSLATLHLEIESEEMHRNDILMYWDGERWARCSSRTPTLDAKNVSCKSSPVFESDEMYRKDLFMYGEGEWWARYSSQTTFLDTQNVSSKSSPGSRIR